MAGDFHFGELVPVGRTLPYLDFRQEFRPLPFALTGYWAFNYPARVGAKIRLGIMLAQPLSHTQLAQLSLFNVSKESTRRETPIFLGLNRRGPLA